MLNMKESTRKNLINDLVKNAAIMLAVHVLTKTRSGQKLFDEESVYGILLTLLAFVFFHVVIVNVVPPL